jgi:transposase
VRPRFRRDLLVWCTGILGDPRTVNKVMKFSVPPGYVRKKAPAKPKLDPFIPVIDSILRDDKSRSKKQQHTAKRIFARLRDEHGFTGGITIVKDYVAGWRQRTQEMFVPLVHPPGHAQADFGEAIGVIGGVERKIHFFAFDLPHSDACFVVGYPAETTEAFCDGHVRAFAFRTTLKMFVHRGRMEVFDVPQNDAIDLTRKLALAQA